MLRSAPSRSSASSTRYILRRDALPIRGPLTSEGFVWVPALRSSAEEALHRVRDTMHLSRQLSPGRHRQILAIFKQELAARAAIED
jgi:hypothetical protein